MIKEINLGKIYKANSDYKQFPQYVVLTKKIGSNEYTNKITYLFFDVQTGQDKGYLTEDEIKIVYVEVE